jgi:hypothetical protein
MSAAVASKLAQWRRAVRQRRALIACACALPLAFGVIALAARVGGWRVAVAASLVAFAAAAFAAWRFASRDDGAALARRLDALSPTLEDSAALLWREPGALTPLQQLQRERLESRLANVDVDVRPPWPHRAILASAVAAFALFVLAAAWPGVREHVDARQEKSAAANKAAAGLVSAQLAITPPAYTGLPPRSDTALDAKVPQDSTLAWRLHFDAEPQAAHLAFHDGSRVDLHHDGGDWMGERTLAASSLYRIELDGAPPLGDDLHRIDVVADRAAIRIVVPDKTLSEYDGAQKTWPLEFEADDDYGIAKAELSVTHAQGDGENIKFDERTIALDGDALDGARRQRYRHALDLGALSLAKGDEVVVRLVVTDNRVPKPNVTRSPSLILRWPADASKDSSGLDGIAQKTMPAYFRSQRQIIIDTEALLADKPALDDAKFLARSDAIGVDQKILRLRYGQFLGEESEGHAEAAIGAGHADANSQVGALAAAHERRKSPRRKARNSATQATSKPNTATSTTSPKPRHCSTRPREPRSNPRSTRCGRRN